VAFRRSNCGMVICVFRGSLFHSVIVSDTGSSSLNNPSCTAASAAIPQKLLVPLKIGHRLFADPPFAYVSKIVRPFCITSRALPRLLSEYFAARAQLETLISENAAGHNPTQKSKNQLY